MLPFSKLGPNLQIVQTTDIYKMLLISERLLMPMAGPIVPQRPELCNDRAWDVFRIPKLHSITQ